MIRAERLTRRYGELVAVDNVGFAIDQGEVVGLLGHNGAGKTTIMKMLTGYLEPSDGSITVDDVDVTNNPTHLQKQLGYLPENLPLYPEMTVLEYLDYAAKIRGVDDASRPGAVRQAVERTDLGGRASSVIGTLSRGYRQRVGVAQTILHAPRFVILDEPTNGLDPSQTQEMRTLIRALGETATVILSTHIMQEVDAVCDRVMILRSGALVLDERLSALREGGRVLLGTDAPMAAVRSALDDTIEVAAAGDNLFALTSGAPVSDAGCADLTRQLVAADVSVFRLHPERKDLETVFREVSEGRTEGAAEGVSHAA